MEAMEERDGSLQTVNTNMESLMKTLQEMVDQLEFNNAHEIALTKGNLDKQDGIAKCSVAAVSLRAAMASTLHPGEFASVLVFQWDIQDLTESTIRATPNAFFY